MPDLAERHIAQWLLDNPSGSIPLGCRFDDCEFARTLVGRGIAKRVIKTNSIQLASASAAHDYLG